MRHRATKAAPSAHSATAFSKYFSPKEKDKYERKKSGSETSLELAAPMRARSARLGNLSCPPKAGEPNAGHLFFGQCDHIKNSNNHNNSNYHLEAGLAIYLDHLDKSLLSL